MILGQLIIGVMFGAVAGIWALIAGWGFGFAFLAYSGVGCLSVLILAGLALARMDRGVQDIGTIRDPSVSTRAVGSCAEGSARRASG